MIDTKILICSCSKDKELRTSATDTMRIIIYFVKKLKFSVENITYLRDDHIFHSIFLAYFKFKDFDKYRILNEHKIFDLEKYLIAQKKKSSFYSRWDFENILYNKTEYSKHSSYNQFVENFIDSLNYNKIILWFSGDSTINKYKDKEYYAIALNHLSESERKDILSRYNVDEERINDLINHSNKIIKYDDDHLYNDFIDKVKDIKYFDNIHNLEVFLGIRNYFSSYDFAKQLNKLKKDQYFLAFFDACRSEYIIDLEQLTTEANILIFSAAPHDKLVRDNMGSFKFFDWIDDDVRFNRTYTCTLAYLILVENIFNPEDTIKILETKLSNLKKSNTEWTNKEILTKFSDRSEEYQNNLRKFHTEWINNIQIITNLSNEKKNVVKLKEFLHFRKI